MKRHFTGSLPHSIISRPDLRQYRYTLSLSTILSGTSLLFMRPTMILNSAASCQSAGIAMISSTLHGRIQRSLSSFPASIPNRRLQNIAAAPLFPYRLRIIYNGIPPSTISFGTPISPDKNSSMVCARNPWVSMFCLAA